MIRKLKCQPKAYRSAAQLVCEVAPLAKVINIQKQNENEKKNFLLI